MKSILKHNFEKHLGAVGLVLCLAGALAHAELPDMPASLSQQSTGANEEKETSLSGIVALRGRTQQDRVQGSQVAGFASLFDLSHKLSSTLEAEIVLKAYAESGSVQYFYSDYYSPHSGLALYDGYLTWKPIDRFNVRFGVITTREISDQSLKDDNLWSDISMPTVVETYQLIKSSDFGLKISAAQAIPVTDTKSSIPTSKETMPFYASERLKTDITLSKRFSIEASTGHFAFKNLPSSVAQGSRSVGNDVTGLADDADFPYAFEGIDNQARLKFVLPNGIRPRIEGGYLVNYKAPDGSNKAASLSFNTEIDLSPNITMIPKVDFFRSESNSTPGFYKADPWPQFMNTVPVGQNNRQGWDIGTRFTLAKEKLLIDGKYVRSVAIRPNPYQSDYWGLTFLLGKSFNIL